MENISNRLLVVPKPARVSALRAELTALNHMLPAEVLQLYLLFIAWFHYFLYRFVYLYGAHLPIRHSQMVFHNHTTGLLVYLPVKV